MGPTLNPVCYRPPPLPTKKPPRTVALVNPIIAEPPKINFNKAALFGDRDRNKDTFGRMSSTYHSFRDPLEESEIVIIAAASEPSPTMRKKKEKKSRNKSTTGFEQGSGGGSLSRAFGSGRFTRRASLLTRSHSDGNLNKNFCKDLDCPGEFYGDQSNLTKALKALNGSWKNLLNLGGMNRQPKAGAQMKKVAPPQVPETAFRHSGSSFGSAGYGSAGEEPVFHDAPVRDGYDMTDCYGPPGKSPGSQFSYPQFTFPGQPYIHINAAKATAHYHQLALQEDQGIDMTQSPGRDSPGSSGSRHSTASLDSGRASSSGSHLTGPGSGSLHHPRCSISSSSVGSTESGASARVERLLMQGVPDHDVLHSWLMDLHFEEYFPLFIAAGYDMSTISRMTPEDLTAIGIKKPNHRKKLKAEIALLTISDGLPDYIPGSLDEWLRLLRLEEYGPALGCQGYETIQDVTQLTWEDLEDIGIVKLGHQKRLMLAIKRVKDLKAGKVFPPGNTGIYGNTIHIQATVESPSNGMLANNMPNIMPDCSIECPRVHTTFKSFHQPWEIEATRNMYCTTDIIPIQIRGGRGKSLESLEDGMNNQRSLGGGTSSFTQLPAAGWRRSYDDGDITPTNESILVPMHEGGGTLPRPKGLVRPRPIAKIPATFVPTYRNEDICLGTLKRRPPSPPKRQNESVTVVADLHCAPYPPPPAPMSPITTNYSCLTPSFKANGSDASFKSVSSTESDSIPFANENAGTIKQRSSRPGADYAPTIELQSKERSSSLSSSRKLEQEPSDVLNDIGNMLANLTDELDAMLEEEKRQNLAEV